jgi:hypothetical protein
MENKTSISTVNLKRKGGENMKYETEFFDTNKNCWRFDMFWNTIEEATCALRTLTAMGLKGRIIIGK